MITQERLKELLHYDPDTGVFTWLPHIKYIRTVGRVAGYINPKGYRVIFVCKKLYKASRLAWLYVHGTFPKYELDHIDRDRNNDALTNLRETTPSENACNRVFTHGNNRYKGVCEKKVGKRNWCAHIVVKGQRRRYAYFTTEKEAALQYNEWAKELHGEYAVLNEVDETDVC
jgi:hypothetical protein